MVEKSMQKNKIKVVDNFLPKDEFDMISEHIESSSFPWYWNYHSVENDGITQFVHEFMDREGINSDFYSLLTSISLFSKLGAKKLAKCKANLNYPTLENKIGVFHTDFDGDINYDLASNSFFSNKNITTSILYINSNNGGTQFEDGTKIESVANRMVSFNCSTKHTSVSCTDQDRRILINFNYFIAKK